MQRYLAKIGLADIDKSPRAPVLLLMSWMLIYAFVSSLRLLFAILKPLHGPAS